MAETRSHTDEAPERLNAREARQGRPGRPVLLILIASLAIGLAALVALLSWQRSEMPDPRPQIERSAPQPNTPPTNTAPNPAAR